MALAPSQAPLYISGIRRINGVTIVTVLNHGFSGVHVGMPIRVSGVSDSSYNVSSGIRVSAVPDANTIEFVQPGLIDNRADLAGGAISVG